MTAIIDIVGREILDSRGNPDRRGRCRPGGRRLGPRRRALGRLDRRPRSGRTARRRQGALSAARACARRSTRSTARSSTRCRASTPRTRSHIDAHDDRARRHAQQGPARRQRHPRRLARRRQAPPPRVRPAALPLCRRRRRPHPAGADDEHHQRRRPCRQPDRHPGIHDHARSARERSPRRSAWARRCSTRCKKAPEGRRAQHQCRRRGRLRAQPRFDARRRSTSS